MTPLTLLVLVALVATAAVGYYYFLLFSERDARQTESGYLGAVYRATKTHFEELKEKERTLKIDKGYGVTDSALWDQEVKKFIALVVKPELGSFRSELISTPAGAREFEVFCKLVIGDIMCYEAHPDKSELEKAAGKQPIKDVNAFWWVVTGVILVLALYIFKFSWVGGLIALLSASLVSPLTYELVVVKFGLVLNGNKWANPQIVLSWAALVFSVVITVSHLDAIEAQKAVDDARRIAAQRAERAAVVLAAKQEQEAKAAALEKKKQEDLQVEYWANRDKILSGFDAAVTARDFSRADVIIDKYKDVKALEGDLRLRRAELYLLVEADKKVKAEADRQLALKEKAAAEAIAIQEVKRKEIADKERERLRGMWLEKGAIFCVSEDAVDEQYAMLAQDVLAPAPGCSVSGRDFRVVMLRGGSINKLRVIENGLVVFAPREFVRRVE